MKHWQIIGIVLILILTYVIFINLFANLILKLGENSTGDYVNGNGADVKIGMSDSISVGVIRKSKILWRTHELNGNSYFKVFNVVPLPKKVRGINFIYFHIVFVLTLIIFILNEIGKQNLYKEPPPYSSMKHWLKLVLILFTSFLFYLASGSGSVSLLLTVLLIYFEFVFKKKGLNNSNPY